jgi:hypothetical protein
MNLRARSYIVAFSNWKFTTKNRFFLIEFCLAFGTAVAFIEKERFNIGLTVMLMAVQKLIGFIFCNY